MERQESFFSKNHKRLLDIATWAKYLAWVVLIIFCLWAIADFIGQRYLMDVQFTQFGQRPLSYSEFIHQEPLVAVRIIMGAVGIFFKGVVYYLVLAGISLGLNMIVETDINYREKAQAAQ